MKMKFREFPVDKALVIKAASEKELEEKIEKVMKEKKLIDLQFSTAAGFYALALVQDKTPAEKGLEDSCQDSAIKIVEKYMHVPTLKLHAGDMGAQEVRTVVAVLKMIVANLKQS
jgi:hypothetical protein